MTSVRRPERMRTRPEPDEDAPRYDVPYNETGQPVNVRLEGHPDKRTFFRDLKTRLNMMVWSTSPQGQEFWSMVSDQIDVAHTYDRMQTQEQQRREAERAAEAPAPAPAEVNVDALLDVPPAPAAMNVDAHEAFLRDMMRGRQVNADPMHPFPFGGIQAAGLGIWQAAPRRVAPAPRRPRG